MREDFSLLLVVPTFNSFDSLNVLVDSLRCQSYTNWRVVFIDGPSSTSHRQWLDKCCGLDPRFTWFPQSNTATRIYGAMNDGFIVARPDEWILFWGSDDWAANSTVFEDLSYLLNSHTSLSPLPDIVVCQARYVDSDSGLMLRSSIFSRVGLFNSSTFRRKLLFGASLPHQATLFGPGARSYLMSYDSDLKLAADLDYFLKLSKYDDLIVESTDLELVCMSNSGVSGQQTKLRLAEVIYVYRNAFGKLWVFCFISRYLRRLIGKYISSCC